MKQGNEANRKAALERKHTLKEELSTNGSETIKQRETKAGYNSKRRGQLVMHP